MDKEALDVEIAEKNSQIEEYKEQLHSLNNIIRERVTEISAASDQLIRLRQEFSLKDEILQAENSKVFIYFRYDNH